MPHWVQPTTDREQFVLISSTLDALIREDHPVRLFDELSARLEWGGFEAHYRGTEGRPAIHPRLLASTLLYGLRLGLRSSRQLEDASRHRVDFMWLLHGMTVDHSTWAAFRTRCGTELKGLSRDFVRLAVSLELVSGEELGVDGTRVAADSSARSTATAATLAKRVAAQSAELEQALAELGATDEREAGQAGAELPPGLRRQGARLARLAQALAAAQAADAGSPPQGGQPERPKAVPVADPEAKVLPHKGGGYGPNYTPVVVSESGLGLVVASEVAGDGDEVGLMLGLVAAAAAATGQSVERVLADAAFGTGQHLAACEAQGIELLAPLAGSAEVLAGVPRAALGEPLAEEVLAGLPRSKQTQRWHRGCFAYAAEEDVYICPVGERLRFTKREWVKREGGRVRVREYRCAACAGCRWREACLREGARGADDQARRARGAAGGAGGEDADGGGADGVPAAGGAGGDGVRGDQGGDGGAAVPVAGVGEGADRVGLGVSGVQPRAGGGGAEAVGSRWRREPGGGRVTQGQRGRRAAIGGRLGGLEGSQGRVG